MKILILLTAGVVFTAMSFSQSSVQKTSSFVSSNLPIVVIDTHGRQILDEPKISADMGIIYNGEGLRNTLADPFNHYNGKIAIEIRGSSSQMFDKKQYGFNTVDLAGADYDVPLLGFPSEHTWILSAQYNDKSLIRDAMTYILSNQTGRYASRTKYCEVFINGDYRGVYIMMEKIKRDKNRVSISKMTTADTTGDNLTGGYIYKIDKADKPTDKGWDAFFPPFASSARRFLMYQYHYPDPEEIMPQQMKYLQDYDKYFETVMMSPSYKDPQIGYPKLLDVPSFLDMVCFNEFSKNVDGYRLSTFLYKDRASKNDKLFAGPYWDYNLGYGNCNYGDAWLLSGLIIDNLSTNSAYDAFAPPFWWRKIWSDPDFKKLVAVRWKALRANHFSTSNVLKIVDSLAAVVNESQQRNFERWPIIGVYVWPNYYYLASSYADEVNWLKGWMINRLVWLDKNWAPLNTAVNELPVSMPGSDRLEQNYPNPFNPSTRVRFATSAMQRVAIVVYDVLGRPVATLVDDVRPAGTYSVEWNAAGMPSGVYYCRMHAGTTVSSLRMTILK